MRITRRQFACGFAGAAAIGSGAVRPQVVIERRLYAHRSALPPPEILRRNGIRLRSMARTAHGTVYLIGFDTLEARVKAWDRFNGDEDWCLIRGAGEVALQEIGIYVQPAGKIFEISL